jgi:hypothetical protein
MTQNVAREVAALGRMTVSDLRSKHIDAFGEPTRTGNRDYLVKRIAWRLQANTHGDLVQEGDVRRHASRHRGCRNLPAGPGVAPS